MPRLVLDIESDSVRIFHAGEEMVISLAPPNKWHKTRIAIEAPRSFEIVRQKVLDRNERKQQPTEESKPCQQSEKATTT